jgi:hypothetical protein
VPIDAGAGYYISRAPVVPLNLVTIDDLLGKLLACDIELRVMPSLWPLCDAVVVSSLHFSCIRMRNAVARDNDCRTSKALSQRGQHRSLTQRFRH